MSQLCPNCHGVNRQHARFCGICGVPLPARSATATGCLAPNTILQGRYIILGNVGKGGQAAVYRAADRQLVNKIWAIKEMSLSHASPIDQVQAEQAFKQEAQILADLNHPGLPRVADFFSEGGRHYLVMDFVTGETLEDLLIQHGKPFSEAEVRDWALQICDILSYLHGQSPPIIYRDLKPSNVMLEATTKRLKLIDLGTARRFKPGQAKDTIPLGTPGYAPPEQYNKKQTDVRSDIYALGATLHHLVTGIEPIPYSNFEQPAKLNPRLSPAFSAVIMQAVESDPARRFQSASEMAQALRRSAIHSGPSDTGAGKPCTNCGTWNHAGAIYCLGCGMPFGVTPPPPPPLPPASSRSPVTGSSPQPPTTLTWIMIIIVGLSSSLILLLVLLRGCPPLPPIAKPSATATVTATRETTVGPSETVPDTPTLTPTATATRRPTSTPIPTPIVYRLYLPMISKR